MDSFAARDGLIYLGLDVHKDSIAVGILLPGEESPMVDRIFPDEEMVRRLIARFPEPARLRACYEAGPTGYGLVRQLRQLGVACEVVAPSLIPRAPGDRVKTDRRDCRRLARLLRAGELVAIRVPSPAEEAVRDLCRARADLVADTARVQHRLGALLLRHGRVWRGSATNWTLTHRAWLAALRLDQPAAQQTLDQYRAALAVREAQVAAIELDLAGYYDRGPFTAAVAQLCAYRGITRLGGLTLASEVGDWRRFPRASTFMGFTGLVPSEYSSGGSTRRGRITRAGNEHLRTQLVEAAWAYQHPPSRGPSLRRRQEGVDPATLTRSWRAQQRLCARFRHLSTTHTNRNVVITAIARELAGFVWAEMTAEPGG